MSSTFEDCSICLCPVILFKRTAQCGHEFHRDCIERWLEAGDTCPLCREPVQYIWPAPVRFDKIVKTFDVVRSDIVVSSIFLENKHEEYLRSLLAGHHGVEYKLSIPAPAGTSVCLSSCGSLADYVCANGQSRWLKFCCAFQDFEIKNSGPAGFLSVQCVFLNSLIKEELTLVQNCSYVIDGTLMYRGNAYRDIGRALG